MASKPKGSPYTRLELRDAADCEAIPAVQVEKKPKKELTNDKFIVSTERFDADLLNHILLNKYRYKKLIRPD